VSYIPETRLDAWEEIRQDLGKRQGEALRKIMESGDTGMTASEVALSFGRPQHYIQGRINELWHMGVVLDSGRRRPCSLSGKEQIVWTWSGSKSVRKIVKGPSPKEELIGWVEAQLDKMPCSKDLFCEHCRGVQLLAKVRKK